MSKKSMAIFIVILVIIIVGLAGGYYLYDLQNKETDKKDSKPTPTPTIGVKNKVWSKEEVSSYILPIMDFAKGTEPFVSTNYSDERIFEICVRLTSNDEIKKEIDLSKIESLKKEGETSLILGEDIRLLAKRYFDRDDFKINEAVNYKYDESRDAYYTTSTFGWTGGGEQYFKVISINQDKQKVTAIIDGYYDKINYENGTKDTTYQANLKCDNNTCHIESIEKQ